MLRNIRENDAMKRTALFCLVLAAAFFAEAAPARTEPAVLGGIGEVDFSDLGDVKEVVFAVRQEGNDGHWYANFGYYARSDQERPFNPHTGGRLDILNLETGGVRTLFCDWEGSVRDPCVDYDAQKVVFSYLAKGTEHFNLYEINLDGTGLRQLTSGPWDDIEPIYLPDGDIMFCSS
ncbi:MAG: hypothetical protein IJJ20_08590, partial [Thermoguttaceae bacterium]|nr:hypothetical protein [Thermoguttaceae bacterium]